MLQSRLSWLLAFLSLVAVSVGFAGPNDFDGSSGQNYRFRFEHRVMIRNVQGKITSIQGEIPVMAQKGLPAYQLVEKVTWEPTVQWYNSRSRAEIRSGALAAGEQLEYRFSYNVAYKDGIIADPANRSEKPGEFRHLQRYLQPEKGIEVGDPRISAAVWGQVNRSDTPKEKTRKLFSYVNKTLTYQVDFSRKASAVTALKSGWGRCEDYAVLYVALCRTAGVPARVVYGFRLDAKELKPGQVISLGKYAHAWAEVYLPDTGWVSVEPTFVVEMNGRRITDYRSFGGFLSGDIHLFMGYNSASVNIKYYCSEKADLKIEEDYQLVLLEE